MEEFIDSASLFSDIYAMQGMKIVLSGTDSLGFWFTLTQELYDRAYTIHTTFIPFREFSRLLGIDSIDEYIRYGGTLRAGDLDFDDEDALAADAAFRLRSRIRRMQGDEEQCRLVEQKYGRITRRCVLYRGEDMALDNGVVYRNVEEYLEGLCG